MKFRTEYLSQRSSLTLSPLKPVVMAGSCFSENIAEKMREHLWKAVNPFGTLYNPFSICKAIDLMLDLEKGYERFEQTLFEFRGIWNSHCFDSSFSSRIKEDCIQEFLNRQKEFLENLSQGKVLIVTFGTSICYHLKKDESIVGNCHKQPSELFYEKRMSEGDVFIYWHVLIESLKKRFPDIAIIFTVSPVRHLKNGFVGNSRSKAVLQLGVEEICKYDDKCFYFPAYEIMLDDLRDYRFYASDLSHPSDEAIEYIWEKFRETFLDEEGNRILNEGSKKFKALHHRPKTGALGKKLT
ncbi:MAG: GSCFA domain-containing protein [Muribaculaceae bacterium]|nr:GSCFA domain-containing protein [Muribaculaceae bacterium]